MSRNTKVFLIIFYIIILLASILILCTIYFPDETLNACLYIKHQSRTIYMKTIQSIANGLLNNKQSPLFAPYYKKIYPPHTHFYASKETEKICYENCYQKYYHLYAYPEKPSAASENLNFDDLEKNFPNQPKRNNLLLNYILRIHFPDIYEMGIRNIQISLLQQLLLWQETQIKKAKGARKQELQSNYEKMIQHIFRSMFDFGNALLHNNTIEQIKERGQQQPVLPDDMILDNHAPRWPLEIRRTSWYQTDMFKKYGYWDQEKLSRIQILLSWMIWKYTPHQFCGFIGLKLKEDMHQLFFTILEKFFLLLQNSTRECQVGHIIADYLI